MASKKPKSSSRPVAIEMLTADHEKVKDLFEQYEDEKEDGEDDAKRALAAQICGELKVHAQVEEEIFYPWLRENLEDDDMELVDEATVEHQSAKDLIAQIESAAEVDEMFDAKVKVLGEYINHHVEEEEGEIFPQVSDMKDELDELGQAMMARKTELMAEMGLDAEDADAPPPAKTSGSKRPSTRA